MVDSVRYGGSGDDPDAPFSNATATSAPGVTDDTDGGYKVGSRWYDTTADKAYVCLDSTAGAAVWTETTDIGRELLLADRTYYVSTTGSDSNDGLTVGAPFLTTDHAVTVIYTTLDFNGFVVTVQLADGTYPKLRTTIPQVGSGSLLFSGNLITPGAVTISTTEFTIFQTNKSTVRYQGIDLNGGGVNDSVLVSGGGSVVTLLAGIRFGTAGRWHMVANSYGVINVSQNYEIMNGAEIHISADTNSTVNVFGGVTVTLTGVPNFVTSFVLCNRNGLAILRGLTFVGTATGKRYNATLGGIIDVAGASTTYLPGNVTGTTATGGQYA